MESDRLLNPVFREFYSERDVVREERRLSVESTPTGNFEEEFDCIHKLREWILVNHDATDAELTAFEKEDHEMVEGIRKIAWEAYLSPILEERAAR